jgi:hypothetical protein
MYLLPMYLLPMYLSRVTFGLQAAIWLKEGSNVYKSVSDQKKECRRALSQDAPIYLMHRFKSRAADITISQIMRQLARDFICQTQILSTATRTSVLKTSAKIGPSSTSS